MSSTPIPHIYLVGSDVLTTVFPSQVLTPLEELRGVARVSLGLLTPVGLLLRSPYRPALRDIATRCRESGIDVGWIPAPPSRTPWLWSTAYLVRQWISKRFRRDQSFIVRCRAAKMTTIAIKALKGFPGAQVIYDSRGSEANEAILVQGLQDTPEVNWSKKSKLIIEQVRENVRIAVTDSAGVTCLSTALMQLLQERFPETPADKFRLVPCCTRVDTFTQAARHRESLRRELGLQDKFVVTYLGCLSWLHLPDEMVRVYQLIRSLLPNAHFLAITTDPMKMQAFTERAGLSPDEVTIRSVSPQDVPRWLVVSDLGLCLLKTNERDRVCSPVKIAEYFSAGIPVVITPHQGDYSAIVNTHGLGVEIDLTEADTQLTARLRSFLSTFGQAPTALRARCTQYAEEHLSWSGVTPRLAEWYHELLDLSDQTLLGSRPFQAGGEP